MGSNLVEPSWKGGSDKINLILISNFPILNPPSFNGNKKGNGQTNLKIPLARGKRKWEKNSYGQLVHSLCPKIKWRTRDS
jgi:hypothetical protein